MTEKRSSLGSDLAEKIKKIDQLFEREEHDAGYQAFVHIRKIWPQLKAAALWAAAIHAPTQAAPCPKCDGEGFINRHANLPDEPCPACSATPQEAQCTCAKAGFPESCDNCDGAHAQRIRNMALDEAARIAENGCLVPPDGGEPTEAEHELCESIALQIRQFKREGAQTRPTSLSRPDTSQVARVTSETVGEWTTRVQGWPPTGEQS